MAVSYGQVTCPSNAATAIVAAANTNTVYVGAGSGRAITLYNPSAQGIYLGDSAVLASTGFLLASGATISLRLNQGDALFGRGASFSPVLHYIESGT